MKKEEIDRLIEESLSKEDAAFYHQFDEQGIFKQWGNIYSSKLGGWAIFSTIIQLGFSGVAFWTGYRFFSSASSEEYILWGISFMLSVFGNGMLKLWHWMQMDKNTIMQEMKRVEFQIAVLTEKITEKK